MDTLTDIELQEINDIVDGMRRAYNLPAPIKNLNSFIETLRGKIIKDELLNSADPGFLVYPDYPYLGFELHIPGGLDGESEYIKLIYLLAQLIYDKCIENRIWNNNKEEAISEIALALILPDEIFIKNSGFTELMKCSQNNILKIGKSLIELKTQSVKTRYLCLLDIN